MAKIIRLSVQKDPSLRVALFISHTFSESIILLYTKLYFIEWLFFQERMQLLYDNYYFFFTVNLIDLNYAQAEEDTDFIFKVTYAQIMLMYLPCKGETEA